MYEYRHVVLPQDIAKRLPKDKLLSEVEWRALGVQQSRGWGEPQPHWLGLKAACRRWLVVTVLTCMPTRLLLPTMLGKGCTQALPADASPPNRPLPSLQCTTPGIAQSRSKFEASAALWRCLRAHKPPSCLLHRIALCSVCVVRT